MSNRCASIAILPFENLSGFRDDARIAAGFVQDLIGELARFPSFGVIAAESTFAVESNELDDAGAGRRLGVEYLLKGSVRRNARALRLNAQLVRLADGQHLWAERYDVSREGLFAVQDEIVARVANALTARIDQTTLVASRRRQITSLAAYECWLRGMECLHRGTIESDDEGRTFFEQALSVDPQYARAEAGLSLSYFNEWSCAAWDCWETKEKLAFEHAQRAASLDPDDPLVQAILGKIEQYRRHHGPAETHYRRALHLAPNDANVLIQLTCGFALLGEAELAVELGERALALNPLCPGWYFCFTALSYFVRRDYARAAEHGVKAPTLVTDSPAYLAAMHAYLGTQERAHFFLEEFRRLFAERITAGRAPEPDEPLRWLTHVNPFRQQSDLDHLIDGLRLAGLDGKPAVATVTATRSWPVGNVFRKEGALWTACFEHEVAHLPEMRGFHDLAQLLARPAEEVHCLTLAGQPADAGRGTEFLDEQARRAYRTRLRELEAERANAEAANDFGRAERLDEEKERLLEEMRKATGIGGRDRKMADSAERARSAVTWRIRSAIRKLERAHPALSRHFGNSIRTGVFCSYTPEKETRWFV